MTEVAATPEIMARTAIERSNLYGFLAAIYRREPSARLLRQMRQPGMRAALAGAGVEIGEAFGGGSDAELLDALTLEYTRLFVGPGRHVSPHASVHDVCEGGALWGWSTVEVKKFIESTGFRYKPEYHGLPDHIGTEFEFMGEVTKRESEAWKSNDTKKTESLRKIEEIFINNHLKNWIRYFCEKVESQAELPFYKEISKLTGRFIASEQEEIGKPEPKAKADRQP
jgi:TorA maturation chaperone TorD